jgi:hypothetical protein
MRYFFHYEGGLMHKILFAAQQASSAPLERSKNRECSFKILIFKDFLKRVYLLSNPVGTLIYKAWRVG